MEADSSVVVFANAVISLFVSGYLTNRGCQIFFRYMSSVAALNKCQDSICSSRRRMLYARFRGKKKNRF